MKITKSGSKVSIRGERKNSLTATTPCRTGGKRKAGSSTERAGSALESAFLLQIRALKLPAPEQEYRFHKTRRWRFDFAWPDVKLAVEIEGGTWGLGRHTSPAGYAKDCEKYNAAAMDGWMVLRFTSDMVRRGDTYRTVQSILNKLTGDA